MKRKMLIVILLVTNIVTAACLLRMLLLKMMWEGEAKINTEFAAKLWAHNDFGKGKLVKLRLSIEKEPKASVSKPTEFDGAFVVREWVGYCDPFPLLGGENSASIQTAKIMVDSYNKAMEESHEHPEQYKKSLAAESEYWKKEVLGTKGRASRPDASKGK